MQRTARYTVLAAFLVATPLQALAQSRSDERDAVDRHLDRLHELASAADFEGYFEQYHDAAIFMGTDASERWTISAFKDYAKPVFDRGSGWTYTSTSRNIYLSDDGNTAWFDEMLDNDNLGETRGTGVLVRSSDGWKIVQYNLTIPVPNQLAREFVARIQSLSEGENE